MKLKLFFLALAAAALTASAAFAAQPAGQGKPATTPASTNATTPTVMFILHGTITAYTAVNGTTNGSVSLKISSSNYVARSLKGQTLAFTISPKTSIVKHNGAQPAVNDRATVKVRAKKATVASLTAASATSGIFQLVDQGKAS